MKVLSSDAGAMTRRLALPSVNLLPPEIAQTRRFRRVQIGLGGAVLGALGVVALLVVAAAGSVSDANDKLDAVGAQQRLLQGQTAQYRDVTATYKRAADAQALLVVAMGDEVRYSRFLSNLSLAIPDNVWVKNITFAQAGTSPTSRGPAPTGIGTLTVSGVAYKHEDVAGWLESLSRGPGYDGPLLQSSTEVLLGTKQVVNWAATATLSPAALSGRYSKTGG